MTETIQKRLVIVEDHTELQDALKRTLSGYPIDIQGAETADQAVPLLLSDDPSVRPDALVLDIMLPYGSDDVRKSLDPNGSDYKENDTGLNLLRRVRAKEKIEGRQPIWTAVTTARSDPQIYHELKEQLGKAGLIFKKPFDDVLLEVRLCEVLQLECKLPAWLKETVES